MSTINIPSGYYLGPVGPNGPIVMTRVGMKPGDPDPNNAYQNGSITFYNTKEVKETIEACRKIAKHDIPYHAYGDNQAACDMSNRLEWIREQLENLGL